MPLKLYSVQQSRVWTESIDKENITRLLWHDMAKRGDVLGESMRFEVFKKKLEKNAIKPLNIRQLPPIDKKQACRNSLISVQHTARRQSLKSVQQSLDKTAIERAERILGPSASSNQVFDMYPVDQQTRDKLYDGFTREGKGRSQYLRQRKQKAPEDKYPFPLCSSWDHGWRLKDNIQKESIRNPVYGRRSIVECDFYTRNQIPQYHSNRHLKPDDAKATILMAE